MYQQKGVRFFCCYPCLFGNDKILNVECNAYNYHKISRKTAGDYDLPEYFI